MTSSQSFSTHENPSPIASTHDLAATWQTLAAHAPAGGRELWALLLRADGTPLPVHPRVTDVPAIPPHAALTTLVRGTATALAQGGHVGATAAFLLRRPGAAVLTTTDHLWASGLLHEAERAGLSLWPTHVATDTEVMLVDDDLLAA